MGVDIMDRKYNGISHLVHVSRPPESWPMEYDDCGEHDLDMLRITGDEAVVIKTERAMWYIAKSPNRHENKGMRDKLHEKICKAKLQINGWANRC